MISGGIQDSSLGIKYQLDLLLLCTHRLAETRIKFELVTEQKNIGKFDDIVLGMEQNGKIRYIFGQAKYRVRPIDLGFTALMNNNNFKLSTYFESWLEILKHNDYKNEEKVIFIVTNNRMDTSQALSNGLVKVDSDDLSASLYFVEDASDHLIFKDLGKRYKFPDYTNFPAERQAVVRVLCNSIKNRNQTRNLIDFYQKLNSFMDQLVFITSLELKDIKNLIEMDLQKRYKMIDVSTQFLKLEDHIKELVTDRGNVVRKITKDEYQRILREYNLFESKLLVIEKMRTVYSEDSRLEFLIKNQQIEDFLDPQINQTNKIFHVKTNESETDFLGMRIHTIFSAADK